MRSRSVQYRGKPVIVAMFQKTEIWNWAIFQDDKALMKCAGEKANESFTWLQEYLSGLEKSNSTAIYELRLYEDITDPKKIKATTEADCSWGFTLFSEDYPSPGTTTRQEGYRQILDEMQDVKLQLAALQKQQEEEAEEEQPSEAIGSTGNRFLGAIDKLLDNPDVQKALGDRFMGWIDQILKPKTPIMQPKQIGAIGAVDMNNATPPITEITQDQADKIHNAVQILAGIVPDLGDVLMQLAESAQDNPKKFLGKISMIKTFL